MPAPYVEERANLCQHERFTTGCPACLLVEQVLDLAEAKSERLGAEEACQDPQDQLAHATNEQEREDAQNLLRQAQSYIPAWDERITSLEIDLAASRVAVKAICDANEPETLVKALADIAEEEMFEESNLWLMAMGEPLVPLVDADPDFKVEHEELDRSQIPATADSLVSEGDGLMMFMAAGRSLRDERTPTQTVGETGGQAFMSHGRALHMFGDTMPPGSGKPTSNEKSADVPSGGTSAQPSDAVQESEDDMLEPLLTELQTSSVASEPRTEAQFREMYPKVYRPTKSTVPEGKNPWTAVLGFSKFGRWTPMLCSQYTELVRAKERHNTVHGYFGWPAVASLTFEGFTNWVLDCKRVDPLFGRVTLGLWENNMKQRKATILEALNARAGKVRASYNDARQGHPRATQYYNGKESLILRDAKKLGLTIGKTKK